MRWLRWLWGLSGTIWKSSATDTRPYRIYGTSWIFLILLFSLVFAVAWIAGYPPWQVTDWLDAHAALWRSIGGWLWRTFWGIVLLVCAILIFGIGLDLFGQRAAGCEDKPRNYGGGCCGLIAVAVTIYIGWIAITMSLD